MNRNDRNEQVLSKMLGTNAIKSGYKGLECGKPLENDDLIMIECKVTDNGLLDKVKSYLAYDEDDDTVLQLGNVYLDFAFDIETGDFGACNVVDTKSSTWKLYPEEIGEIFGKDFLNYKKSNFIDSGIEALRSSKQIESSKTLEEAVSLLRSYMKYRPTGKVPYIVEKDGNYDVARNNELDDAIKAGYRLVPYSEYEDILHPSKVIKSSVLNKLNDAWNLLHNVKIELRKQKNQNKDAEIYYNDIIKIVQELDDFLDEFEKNPV